jgi:hypothetical protein
MRLFGFPFGMRTRICKFALFGFRFVLIALQTQRTKARRMAVIGGVPRLAGGHEQGALICTVMEAAKGLPHRQL